MFIAVIGITSGPSFVSGIKDVGFGLFLAGIVCTSLPLILSVIIGHKIFKFRPAINLGCCAGSRTLGYALRGGDSGYAYRIVGGASALFKTEFSQQKE